MSRTRVQSAIARSSRWSRSLKTRARRGGVLTRSSSVEDRPGGTNGVLGVRQLRLVGFSEPRVQIDQLEGVFGPLHSLLEDAGQLGPRLERRVDPIEVPLRVGGEGLKA